MTRIHRLLVLSLLLLAAACAAQSGGGADGPRRQNNVITLEEIEAMSRLGREHRNGAIVVTSR